MVTARFRGCFAFNQAVQPVETDQGGVVAAVYFPVLEVGYVSICTQGRSLVGCYLTAAAGHFSSNEDSPRRSGTSKDPKPTGSSR